MNRTLSIFALLALLFSTACSSTSIVHLINGEEVVMDISRSDGETLYGVDENRTRNIQIRQRDVAEIEFPGSTEILVGAIAMPPAPLHAQNMARTGESAAVAHPPISGPCDGPREV